MRKHLAGNLPASKDHPLTHEERLELIRAPFPTIHTVYQGHSWAGANTTDEDKSAIRPQQIEEYDED